MRDRFGTWLVFAFVALWMFAFCVVPAPADHGIASSVAWSSAVLAAAPRRVECKNGVCRIVSTVPPAPVADVAVADRLERAPSPAPAPADSAPGAPTPADPATRPMEKAGEPRVMRSVLQRPVKAASKARGFVRRLFCRGCR